MDHVKRLHVTPQQIHDLIAFAASTDSSLMPQGSSPDITGNPQLGAQLFVRDRCIKCHQVNGVGGTDSPDLTHDPAATNYDLMKSELEIPPKAMAYVTKLHLTPQQIAALSAFADSSLKPLTKK
jgi:mono/diheme cytochrome c family protein